MAQSAAEQTFQTHRRWLASWHFFAFPVLAINVIVAAVALFKNPGLASGWWLAVSLALAATVFTARTMAITVQDRLIRLEERLRLRAILAGREQDIEKLTVDQLVGLRFAADGEVAEQVDRVLAGELTGREDIKKAVSAWRPDTLRV
jgi:hypothetical protein